MATAKKTDAAADAAETAGPVEEPALPVQAAATEPPAGPARLEFVGPIPLVVAGVGPCVPGVVYPVPESVAAEVCRGGAPLFVRVTD